jgi:hypothetical protein
MLAGQESAVLLKQLEAENAELRRQAIDLALEIVGLTETRTQARSKFRDKRKVNWSIRGRR